MAIMDLKLRIIPDMRNFDSELKKRMMGAGSKGGKSEGKNGEAEEVEVKGLGKALTIWQLLFDVIKGIDYIIKPVLGLLSALLAILFLPLVPILKPVLQGIAKGLPDLLASAQAVAALVQKIIDFIFGGGIVDFVKNFFGDIWSSVVQAWETLKEFGAKIWEEYIVPAWEWLLDLGKKVWEQYIKPGFMWYMNIGQKIWDTILKPAWEWFSDIGSKIWNIIKGGWEAFVGVIKGAANAVIKLVNKVPGVNIPYLAQGGIVTRPTMAVIGEAGPEAVIPLNRAGGAGIGGNITVNIYNPVANSQNDINRLATEVGRVLQQEMRWRRS